VKPGGNDWWSRTPVKRLSERLATRIEYSSGSLNSTTGRLAAISVNSVTCDCESSGRSIATGESGCSIRNGAPYEPAASTRKPPGSEPGGTRAGNAHGAVTSTASR
jgi:hypothetical protein